ncbi:MAG: DUF6101 family protein [Pseudomonadota bacterium]
MNAVGLSSAAIALPVAAAVVVTNTGTPTLSAANDSAPLVDAIAAVTLPARFSVRRRRDHRLDVSISREAVTISSPDAAAATQPVKSYRGISASVVRGKAGPEFHLTLEHEDSQHCVPLAASSDIEAVAREWQAWAKALCLPLLAIDADGAVHGELNALGVILAERPSPRRRGSPLVGRRSRYARKRRATPPTRALGEAPVHTGEREIIART